jgi:hypothetical protein
LQGTLAQLDTRNPTLYIDFPDGRLKFVGTLFFPKNKYMTLRFAQKEVLCEDIFESMVSSFTLTKAGLMLSLMHLNQGEGGSLSLTICLKLL